MKIYFDNLVDGVLWIARHAKTESHFKIMREELELNHLLSDQHFIHEETTRPEVLSLAA